MLRTLRAKFIVGFFLIFSLSFVLMNQIVEQITRSSNQKIVTQDLIGLKTNSNVYVRQAFAINHFTNDDLYFGQMAQELVSDLDHATSSRVGAYTVDGVRLYASDAEAFAGEADGDLRQAIQGKTAYTISYERRGASVLFAYPVVIDGVTVGILRFSKDFTLVYEQSGRILDLIFYIALAIFAAAFLFSYLLSRHITVPLTKLARTSSEVAGGNLDARIELRRKDEIGRLAGNFNDMVGRIRAQIATIERDRDRLESLNKQRKVFFDNVTHELKTPLTSILGYAEMIRENGEEDRAFFDKGMDHIVAESKRLHELVLRLLEASRETAGREAFVRVELGRLLRDVCESMAFKAKRYQKTIRCGAEEELFVYGQPNRLRQLLINLLDNAIKYGDSPSEIAAEAKRDAGFVRVVIANDGETIPPGQLTGLFEPFYLGGSGAKEAGSVGLGLGIVKEIALDHDGSVRMTSENRRTSVSVDIPYRKAEDAE